ncbi:MAG: C40 family peptidase, partial [Thiohalophilus sp.]|uniref:C40 family peptidase n=1 Tax=Thiohalophilus sp. TaxID=3028392 RepID=UPI00286FD753
MMRFRYPQSAPLAGPRTLLLATLALLMLSGCGMTLHRSADSGGDREKVVEIARDLLGTPYRYGGESPRHGFDCSGLVQYAYQQAGLEIARTTGQQYRQVQAIPSRFLRPGDLVFFSTKYNRFVSHVGIYLGNNRFIHAPSSGKTVSVANLRDPYWRRHFAS